MGSQRLGNLGTSLLNLIKPVDVQSITQPKPVLQNPFFNREGATARTLAGTSDRTVPRIDPRGQCRLTLFGNWPRKNWTRSAWKDKFPLGIAPALLVSWLECDELTTLFGHHGSQGASGETGSPMCRFLFCDIKSVLRRRSSGV
jgi:hypothetical protein